MSGLKQCPYNKAVQCLQDETCLGCETLAILISELTESNDTLCKKIEDNPTDKMLDATLSFFFEIKRIKERRDYWVRAVYKRKQKRIDELGKALSALMNDWPDSKEWDTYQSAAKALKKENKNEN